MSLLEKLGILAARFPGRAMSASAARNNVSRVPVSPSSVSYAAVNFPRSGKGQEAERVSNGLKEFLRNLDGLGRGKLLDLGPAWQTTLSFFIERGFRVSSEDLLRAWKEFLVAEEKNLQTAVVGGLESVDMTADGRAVRFLTATLQYPPLSFDAILL
jgi:hypothetical protein